MPPYTFQPAFSHNQHRIFRYDHNYVAVHTGGMNNKVYQEVDIALREINPMATKSITVIRDCILKQLPLQGFIQYEKEGINCRLEFPVKHINYHISLERFQVETGPVLVYDGKGYTGPAFLAFKELNNFEM